MRAILPLALLPLIAAAPTLSGSDRAQALIAAGFVGKTTCATGNPGWPKSELLVEAADLNGDGKPEAIVSESNVACYGNVGTSFMIVARGPNGKWRKLGGATGIPMVRKTKRLGWHDIEAGGPGFGRMPLLRWDGKGYR